MDGFLRNLESPLCTLVSVSCDPDHVIHNASLQVKDLRSQVLRETCGTIRWVWLVRSGRG